MTRLQFVLLSTLALVACRQQKPATVVPEAPRVLSFTASSTTLETAGPVTLSWSTANATSVQLSRAEEGALAVAEDQLTGTAEVQVSSSTIFVMVARGPGGSAVRAVSVNVAGAAPSLTLVALPAIVPGGGSTTIAWTAPGARAVTLLEGATPLDTRGQITSGALVVRPDHDTVYTLSDGTRTVTVTVSVQLALLSAELTPGAAQVGDEVTLSWTSAGAERVLVSSPGRGQLAEITDAARLAAGSYIDEVPVLPQDGVLTYEVTAVQGSERRSRTLTLYVGSQLSIVRLDAPPVARAGSPYIVRWTTLGANRVQVLVEGQMLFETRSAGLATQSGFAFTSPADDFQVTLVATNDRGGRVTRSEQVDSVGMPSMATLAAAPSSVASGDAVTLTFDAPESRRVRITDGQGTAVFSVRGQDAERGTAIVYPTASTTYTLSADNLLGDPAVTATAQVTVTGAGPTVRQVPATAITGQFIELQPTVPGAVLSGFPHQTVHTGSSSNFVDISGTGERVLELGADVALVTPVFSTMLWGEPKQGQLTISRAGWLAWGGPFANTVNDAALPNSSPTIPAGIIAPYWDDLVLTARSAVFIEVVGEAPDQRLIVQWDKVQFGTDSTTLATFQVQVHQAGMVSFHYDTMSPNVSPTFTVGLQDPSRQLGFDLFGTTPPASNTSVYFFSPLSVPPTVRALAGTRWGGWVKVGNTLSAVSQPATVVRVPQDLSVSELMFRPAPGVTAGQYVEAVNLTSTPYDLSGWVLRSNDGSTFTLPTGSTLPANGHLTMGASTDAAENDDAGVTVSWAGSGFSLNPDAGTLTLGTTDAGTSLNYAGPADGGRGIATEVDPGPFITNTITVPQVMTCTADAGFGSQTPSQLGTPGRNGGCGFAYQREGVAYQFHDISTTGTVLPRPDAGTEAYYPVTLAAQSSDPAPRLYGTRAPTLTVSSNGWLSPRTFTNAYNSNKGSQTGAEPMGVIAPFWDALKLETTSSMHWQKFEPGEDPLTPARHWIVQWTDMNSASAGANSADHVTFQVKLFEDGSIEFHYRETRAGSVSGYGEGFSATIWVDEPVTARTLVIAINTRVKRDQTAIRFAAR